MIVEILFVLVFARLKGHRVRTLFHTWTFYPVLAVQLMLVVFQASLFFQYYGFVPMVPYVEMAVILSFVPAMFTFSLYRPAVLGAGSVVLGTWLNRLVIAQNGGKMPVYPTLSYWTGYTTPAMFGTVDSLHVLGDASTKLKFLTDYIDYGYSILSLGDVLIHLFACFMLYALIRAASMRYAATSVAGGTQA